jgi:alpha-beta hydrolase superfamily lysophospholipase
MQRVGNGTPVILIHGIQASGLVWAPVIESIAAGGHDVLVPTLAGHRGGPPLAPDVAVSLAALADDVESQLNHAGIEAAHLVGNSLGGWVALELAHRGRGRSVVALSPAGGWSTSRDLARVVRLLSTGRRNLIRHRELIVRMLRRPRARRLALRLAAEHGELLSVHDLNEFLLDIAGCEVFDQFMAWVRTQRPLEPRSLQAPCPVLIAWGARDRTLPFKRYGPPLLAAVPEAEHITLPGVGHTPMFDDPQLVTRTVLEFIHRIDNQGDTPTMPEPSTATDLSVAGTHGPVLVRRWDAPDPNHIVVIAHGYGEHSGRYEHVAHALVASGAVVYAPDHHAHGRTAGGGELALFDDLHDLVADLDLVIAEARAGHPALPLALIGHSMGGIIATRYVQTIGAGKLDALVLSAPVIGGNPAFKQLLAMDPIPEVPIDPAALSRDPAVGEDYAADPLVYHGPFKRPTLAATLAAVEDAKTGPGFGSLPVLWIHGELDQLAPLELTKPVVESLAGEELESHIYPGAMHEIFNEINRDEVLGDVVLFLDRLRSPVEA